MRKAWVCGLRDVVQWIKGYEASVTYMGAKFGQHVFNLWNSLPIPIFEKKPIHNDWVFKLAICGNMHHSLRFLQIWWPHSNVQWTNDFGGCDFDHDSTRCGGPFSGGTGPTPTHLNIMCLGWEAENIFRDGMRKYMELAFNAQSQGHSPCHWLRTRSWWLFHHLVSPVWEESTVDSCWRCFFMAPSWTDTRLPTIPRVGEWWSWQQIDIGPAMRQMIRSRPTKTQVPIRASF